MSPLPGCADCYDATRAMPSDATDAVAAGILRALQEVTPAPSVLEVGIGTGRIAIPLAAAGAHVAGIDIAPAMLARLRAKRPDLRRAVAEYAREVGRAGRRDGARALDRTLDRSRHAAGTAGAAGWPDGRRRRGGRDDVPHRRPTPAHHRGGLQPTLRSGRGAVHGGAARRTPASAQRTVGWTAASRLRISVGRRIPRCGRQPCRGPRRAPRDGARRRAAQRLPRRRLHARRGAARHGTGRPVSEPGRR